MQHTHTHARDIFVLYYGLTKLKALFDCAYITASTVHKFCAERDENIFRKKLSYGPFRIFRRKIFSENRHKNVVRS